MKTMKKLFKDESGATAIEYGLIAALIAVFAIFAMQRVGDGVVNVFETAADELDTAG